VSHQLYGTTVYWETIKKEAINWLLKNKFGTYNNIFIPGESYIINQFVSTHINTDLLNFETDRDSSTVNYLCVRSVGGVRVLYYKKEQIKKNVNITQSLYEDLVVENWDSFIMTKYGDAGRWGDDIVIAAIAKRYTVSIETNAYNIGKTSGFFDKTIVEYNNNHKIYLLNDGGRHYESMVPINYKPLFPKP
jgi:hypothetical protein